MTIILGISFISSVTLCALHSASASARISLRVYLLSAALIEASFLFVVTEGLSLVHGLAPAAVSACWIVFLATKVALIWRARTRLSIAGWRAEIGEMRGTIRALTASDRAMLVAAVGLASLAGVIALAAAPNNWDSMAHGLPRVLHWIQNASVEFFPARDVRFLAHPPFAGYIQAHLMLLSGGDAFAHLPQWLALIGTAIAVSLLAKELGLPARGQIAAAFFALSLPPALLQCITPKEDLVAAFLLASGLALAFRWRLGTGIAFTAVGCSLGLALLSKATAYIFVPAVLATIATMWFMSGAPSGKWRTFLRTVLASAGMIALMLALAAPFLVRNLRCFGHPTGAPELGAMATNEEFGPRAIAANLVRNVALHFQSADLFPVVGEPMATLGQKTVGTALSALPLDLDNPKTTWPGTKFSTGFSESPRWHEDFLGAPVHLLLIATGSVVALRRRSISAALLAGGLAVAFLLFAAALKWQPWHTRLHTPLLLLGAPLAATAFVALAGRIGTWLGWVVLTAGGTATLLLNYMHPSFGPASFWQAKREDQLLRGLDSAYTACYKNSASALAAEHPASVGLLLVVDGFEYPLWQEFARAGCRPSIRHVEVQNLSAQYRRPEPPCAFVFSNLISGKRVQIEQHQYSCIRNTPPFRLYRLEDPNTTCDHTLPVTIGHCEGLESPEGPYPQWGLFKPVRWMTRRAASLEISSVGSGGLRAVLRITARSPLPDQSLRIFVGDEFVGERQFAMVDSWETVETTPFALAADSNTIRLEAGKTGRPYGGSEKALLLQEIEVLEVPSPSTDTGANPKSAEPIRRAQGLTVD